MPQLFPRSANTAARVFIVLIVGGIAGTGWTAYTVWWSPYLTRVNVPLEQPIPFSHEHHVSGLGIDCRYCHTGVETSAFAGLPPTETCMTCHSQVWRDAPILEPVRASLREGTPLQWTRINDLPDFVFFNHAIHVHKGVGCVECHGPVGRMPITWRGQSLYMKWCLDCHRAPEDHLRPRALVTDPRPTLEVRPAGMGAQLARDYDVSPEKLADCSVCHR